MQSSEKFAYVPVAQVLRGIALIFPRTLFYEKTAKTLCVTIRNFVQFYFVYIYAKITRFLINERRTYPYILVVAALPRRNKLTRCAKTKPCFANL